MVATVGLTSLTPFRYERTIFGFPNLGTVSCQCAAKRVNEAALCDQKTEVVWQRRVIQGSNIVHWNTAKWFTISAATELVFWVYVAATTDHLDI